MKSVELFAGAGGLAIGIHEAGFEHQALIEWNQWCCDTLRENSRQGNSAFRNCKIHQADVRKFSYAETSNIDLVCGGPPCQPFSIGGKHQAYNDSRDMFPEAVRAVRELRPKAFIFENVKGLTRQTFANYFEYIKLQLTYPDFVRSPIESWEDHYARLERHYTAGGGFDDLQYRVVSRVLLAADYGIPQKRSRVFIVGFRCDLGLEWSFPEATHSEDALLYQQWVTGEYWDRVKVDSAEAAVSSKSQHRGQAIRELPLLKPWRTVREAIDGLENPEKSCDPVPITPNHKHQPGARAYVGHTGSPLDEPSKALKAGGHGVPGGENMLARADGSVRYFTVRESARLQGFADDYLFHGAWGESMRQLGNAVPVTLGYVVGSSVRKLLAGSGIHA